ncbi:MAG TPA: PIN domain-containing protein [Anaerolineae bacterium]|nr:PIN domain-containing protein [Anaerolineae bacterium]
MPTRVYLDTSIYNRPFDDQTQPRIWLETMAFSVILQMIEDGLISLISSAVIEYENHRNPPSLRREWVKKITHLAVESQQVNEAIRQRAHHLEQERIKAMDALHLACAEAAKADYFVTADDRLIKRYQQLKGTDAAPTVCNPTEFVRHIEEV